MRKGFTLVELLVVFGIMIALGAVVFANLAARRSNADLTATTQKTVTLLRQAQSDAAFQENNAQANDVAWGVHFANTTATPPFYALFTGSYMASTTVGYYVLPPTVAYQTSTLAVRRHARCHLFPDQRPLVGFNEYRILYAEGEHGILVDDLDRLVRCDQLLKKNTESSKRLLICQSFGGFSWSIVIIWKI